jgi:hypothetical protein
VQHPPRARPTSQRCSDRTDRDGVTAPFGLPRLGEAQQTHDELPST